MGLMPDDLIVLALAIPLFTAAGVFLASSWPNLREGITLLGSVLLFFTVIALLPDVLAGERPDFTCSLRLPFHQSWESHSQAT